MLASLTAAFALAAAGPTYSGETYVCSDYRRGDFGVVSASRGVVDVEGQPVSEGGYWVMRDASPRVVISYAQLEPGGPLTPVSLEFDQVVKPAPRRHSWVFVTLDTGAQTRLTAWGDPELKLFRGERLENGFMVTKWIRERGFLDQLPKARRLTIDVLDDQGTSLAHSVVAFDVAVADAEMAALRREQVDYRKRCKIARDEVSIEDVASP